MWEYAIAAVAALQELEADRHFEESIRDLPLEVKVQMRRERKEAREKARKEATEERRHQELVSAIKKSGRWPGGW